MTTANPAVPGRNVLVPFALFVLLVGGAPVAVRIGYAELAPFWMGLARFALAASVFWMLVLCKRIPVPRGRALLGAVLYGILGVGISFVLMAWGLVKTSASLAAILMAMVPLMTVLLSAIQGLESIRARGVFGSLLAIAGTAITVGGASPTDISLPHIVAIILGTAFVAQSGVVIKRYPANPPIMTNAIAMTIGAFILGFTSLVTGEAWVIPTQTRTWTAFGYLVVFVTILAFLLYLQVLNKWTASSTSYGFVIIPLVTVVVASILANEQINANFLGGAGLVLAGVLVGALLPVKDSSDDCRDSAGRVIPDCF